ncbi:MAG: phosphoglycolate phosphatase [Zoogloea sp.]|uniref:phosphoglycolate phosphatase n=1 Tax=Zoogloea sp. TaxID=49181 RepID=UPI003F408C2B
METGRIKAVLFDLDGTLVDSIPDLAEACHRMMLDLGRPPHSVERVRTFVGKGMLNLVRRCLGADENTPQAEIDAAVARFRHHYAQVNGEQSLLYPGVREGLEQLQAAGLPLACVTNKPEEFTFTLLEKLDLARYFAATVGGDTLPHKKPHPAPLQHACAALGVAVQQALMVGDSANDAQAAQACGMPVVLVPYGYSEGVLVDSIKCDGLVSSLIELPLLLQRI